MPLSVVIMFLLIGVIGGFIAGLLGVGGGVLFVPCLHLGFQWMGLDSDMAFLVAVGTSLSIIVVTSLSSALGHALYGSLTGGQILSMALLAVPSSVAGAGFAEVVGGFYLRKLFGFFLFFVAYWFLKPGRTENIDPDRLVPVPDLMIVGGISGFMSSLLGIGGGIITVSLLHLVLRQPIHRAVANSSGLIVFTTIAGTLSWIYMGLDVEGLPKFSIGYVNLVAWAVVAFSAVIFAQAGAWTASHTKPEKLKKPFAVMLVLVGIKMVFF